MDIIIRNSGGVPIYDQITRQMKGLILRGELKEGEALPSMRLLAKELRISVITTKRAYEELERDGFLDNVPGKGCFVAPQNRELLREAQLKALEAQINPHFLFNSLNAGAQLAMMGDADNTGIFLEKMADFFRYNVRKMEEDAMLWEEIGAVDNYIYILNVRFAGDITYIKEVDEGIDNIRIPSMILQPLVENAVQHGIHDCMETGWIRMEIHRNGEMLDVTVSDNGAGMTEEMIARVMAGRADQNEEDRFSTGIAVRNVIDRLQLYYKEENLFTIESDGPGKGTRVHIILPVYKDELE